MEWNFHSYYSNQTDGLISKLKLGNEQLNALKKLRKAVRIRIREVFDEAKVLARRNDLATVTLESFKAEVARTRLKHLPPEAQEEAAILIKNMDATARTAFLALAPRFRTQGSFQYDTLNTPYRTPPQEMDIDDGTYLPMTIFEDKPVIGHRLLLLLVDTALESLVQENKGWLFEAKDTCARIKIPELNTHIDVPMYAIPDEDFQAKEEASLEHFNEAALTKALDSAVSFSANNRAYYSLEPGTVNLALRGEGDKWRKSDPQIVEDWFKESCERIGTHLKHVCRFMKAWRDTQWKKGGPSSILLMTATVNILDRIAHDKNDLGATMRLIVKNLPIEFARGVKSPDDTDEKLLFPSQAEHNDWEKAVMLKLQELGSILSKAQSADSNVLALQTINEAFGQRVTRSELIVRVQAAPAFKTEPSAGEKAKKISTTMASG